MMTHYLPFLALIYVSCGSAVCIATTAVEDVGGKQQAFLGGECLDGRVCELLWSRSAMTITDVAIAIRDRVRRMIGRWNEDNLEFADDDSLLNSIGAHKDQASGSCGVMAFALELALAAHSVKSRLVSFHYVPVSGDALAGHTAIEFLNEEGRWVFMDGHAGVVWQDKRGRLASATDVACQMLCYGNKQSLWPYYPSIDGRMFKVNFELTAYTLAFMDLRPDNFPQLISGVSISQPTGRENVFIIDKLLLLGQAKEQNIESHAVFKGLEKRNMIHKDMVTELLSPDACGCAVADKGMAN